MRAALFLLVSVMLLSGTGGISSVEDKIEARRGYCAMLGHNVATLRAMADRQRQFDERLVGELVANIEHLATMDVGALYPAGSDNAAYPGETRMLPVAFADRDDYRKRGGLLRDAAAKAAPHADHGLHTMRIVLSWIEAECTGCHKAYRADSF